MSKVDEADMTFLGFLVLFDPPKANIIETIEAGCLSLATIARPIEAYRNGPGSLAGTAMLESGIHL
jgi:hypothetical protein